MTPTTKAKARAPLGGFRRAIRWLAPSTLLSMARDFSAMAEAADFEPARNVAWQALEACWDALEECANIELQPGDVLMQLYAAAWAEGRKELVKRCAGALMIRMYDTSREPLVAGWRQNIAAATQGQGGM